jgi:hypothetical protein
MFVDVSQDQRDDDSFPEASKKIKRLLKGLHIPLQSLINIVLIHFLIEQIGYVYAEYGSGLGGMCLLLAKEMLEIDLAEFIA